MKQKGNDKTMISTTIFTFDFYSLSCFSFYNVAMIITFDTLNATPSDCNLKIILHFSATINYKSKQANYLRLLNFASNRVKSK